MHWTAFFSRTGSELECLSTRFNRYPDMVITNKNMLELSDIPVGLLSNPKRVCYTRPTPTAQDYDRLLSNEGFITLHGWMKIVPPEICEKYEIYNLHPGNITEYPQLKGKDPQEKAYELGHTKIGCVIHKCEPELDSGKVLLMKNIEIPKNSNLDVYYTELKHVAVKLWLQFLTDKLNLQDDS